MNKFEIKDFSLRYSDGNESLRQINLAIPAHSITVLFGPAGGGKSTLLRVLNRLNDLADVVSLSGQVTLFGEDGSPLDILEPKLDVTALRRRVAMVFARPIVLPMSIRENLTYGLKIAGVRDPVRLAEAVESSLQKAALWEEVRDRLDQPAVALSGGQQQRLCIARSLALEPEVILLDEPTSGLDPISTGKVEDSLHELKARYTVVLVPHSVQQAARMAEQAAFFLQGELIEYGPGKTIFLTPLNRKTQDYVEGRFG
ncbi:MAG TPA: phosphate ABC transporter ATP-binding protein [Anaerolineales bacterium]|nr:phosphate ABC transporter ATP-binding protein [Anaerolineales bacterium]